MSNMRFDNNEEIERLDAEISRLRASNKDLIAALEAVKSDLMLSTSSKRILKYVNAAIEKARAYDIHSPPAHQLTA